jgi:hypothetical protein
MLARNLSESQGKKAVVSGDLQKIEWVQTVAPAGLSQREKNAFYVILAALRLVAGASRIKSSVGELAAVHRRAGVPGSPATVRRAFSGLESKGFLWRRRCRLGSDRLGIEIIVNRERWAYWLQARAGKVVPIKAPTPPTSVYIPTRQSMGAGDIRTITQSSVNTRNNSNSSNNTHKGGSKKQYKYHPIVFTLWCVLTKAQAPDRRDLLNRADLELKARGAGVRIDPHSGTPWEQFERDWSDMTVPVRESFANSEIVPRLRGKGEDNSTQESITPPPSQDEPPATEDERREIRSLIEGSIASISLPEEPAPARANYPEVDMTDPVMRELAGMRDRMRARRID